MHETSALWKQIFAEPDHRKEVKVTINGAEYNPEDDRLIRASISGSLFDAPSVGGAVSRTLELELVPWDGGGFPPMSEIRLFVRLVSADGQRVSEYIPKGVFYSDAVKRDYDTGAVTVTAFDAIMKMERMFSDAVCRVVFDDGYGKIQRFVREIGDPMPAPNAPTHAGLRFVAWRPNPSATAAVVRDMRFIAQWEEAGVIASGDWWTLFDNGLLDVYCEGDMPNYGAPDIASQNPAPWGSYCNDITSVVVSDSVTSIGDYAFSFCENLANVTIPDNVTSIGDFAFGWTHSLNSIMIPDSVTSIGDYAFFGASLPNVTIPDSVTHIGNGAFKQSKLRSVTVGNGLVSAGEEEGAFFACDELESVTINEGATFVGFMMFFGCPALKSVVIPNGVTSIGAYAFDYCLLLSSVTLPISLQRIGYHVFVGTRITDVYYGGTSEQRDSILGLDEYNTELFRATWHYNSSGPT